MKIRLSENFIRIRISPDDAHALIIGNAIVIELDLGMNESWICEVSLHDTEKALAFFDSQQVNIQLPKLLILEWLDTSAEKIKWPLGNTQISVEKDYPCEHQSSDSGSTFVRPE